LRELEEVYNIFQIYPSSTDLTLLIEKHDKDCDGKLSFNEFAEMILPRDKNYASLVLNRKGYHQGKSF